MVPGAVSTWLRGIGLDEIPVKHAGVSQLLVECSFIIILSLWWVSELVTWSETARLLNKLT